MNKMLCGIVLIILGIIIGLNSLNITNINLFFNGWWTLFIIIPCIINLFNKKGKIQSNLIGLFIGILLLLICNNVIDIEIIAKLTIPVILVLIGINLIINNISANKITNKINKNMNNDIETITATFSEQKVTKENISFRSTILDSVFGSITLDLKESKIAKESIIKVSSIFSKIDIILPENVNVYVKATPIFGSVNNKKENSNQTTKDIYIEAFSLFGGVSIK